MALTLSSYFFSDQSGGDSTTGLLLFFAVLKVCLIALYFMELKKAHFGWMSVLGVVLGVYFVFVLVVS